MSDRQAAMSERRTQQRLTPTQERQAQEWWAEL